MDRENKPFPSPKYNLWSIIKFYADQPLTVILRWELTVKHVVTLIIYLFLAVIWLVGVLPNLAQLTDIKSQTLLKLTVTILGLGLVLVLAVFVVTSDNLRRFGGWIGVLSPELRKAEVTPDDTPRMRLITRMICYVLIGAEIGSLIWFVSVFLKAEDWQNQILRYIDTWFFINILTITTTLHLDKWWVYRKTKLPFLTAIALGVGAALIFHAWYSKNSGFQWKSP